YDEQNRLLAGEWQGTDGSNKSYQRGGVHSHNQIAASRGVTPTELDRQTVWREALVVQTFAIFVGTSASTVEERPSAYDLSYQLPPDGVPGLGGTVVKAMLTLEKSELRPIAQTLLVKYKDRNPQSREYRFIESSYERLAPGTVPGSVFQPEAELLGSTSSLAEAPQTTVSVSEER